MESVVFNAPETLARLLVLESRGDLRLLLEAIFREERFTARFASDLSEAIDLLKRETFDLAVADLALSGMDLLQHIKEEGPELPTILITTEGSIESAVEAMRKGAFDYVAEPFRRERIRFSLRKALRVGRLLAENRYLREEIERRYDFRSLVGTSPTMLEILRLAGDVSQTDTTVLILGESGTGKELIARAIHYNSRRAAGPFLALNCAALPENLLESELFGYEKGAFTGATQRKKGTFERAAGGTLFLDEVGEMSLAVQAKVLRVLEAKEFQRLGGTEVLRTNVRILTATNMEPSRLVREGKLREDLYYRINVFPIVIPPLRDREEDIVPLALHFLRIFSREMGKKISGFSPEARALLLRYAWPGNVRELENAIERACILGGGESVEADHLPAYLRQPVKAADLFPPRALALNFPPGGISLEKIEKSFLLMALRQSGGKVAGAARLLGITRPRMRYKIKKYGIDLNGLRRSHMADSTN